MWFPFWWSAQAPATISVPLDTLLIQVTLNAMLVPPMTATTVGSMASARNAAPLSISDKWTMPPCAAFLCLDITIMELVRQFPALLPIAWLALLPPTAFPATLPNTFREQPVSTAWPTAPTAPQPPPASLATLTTFSTQVCVGPIALWWPIARLAVWLPLESTVWLVPQATQ